MPADRPPFGWHAMWTQWTAHPGWLLAGLVLLVGYLLLARTAAGRGRPVHPARIGCWVFGVALLELTLASAIDVYAMDAFYIHMIEHLLLIMCVPIFLVLGRPLGLVADALPERPRATWLAGLRSWPVSVLLHPLSGLVIYGTVIVATHLTGFMDQMVMHPWLMTFEQVLYVVAGCCLLIPMIGEEPIRWDPPYLFRFLLMLMSMVPDTVVGIVLMQSETNPFPTFMSLRPDWAPRPVFDLQIGGGLMWAGGDGVMMAIGFGLVVALISGESRRAHVIGPWLESVRRSTLSEHVAGSGAAPATGEDFDPDGEESLAAYNRMLGELDKHGQG